MTDNAATNGSGTQSMAGSTPATDVDDPMAAEFDTLAEWTADAAVALGQDYRIPAGCRGSGSPAALDWLLERLQLTPGALLADVGAGVGGPAAYAAQRTSARPVLLEPAAGACRAAGRLYGLPVVRADAVALPLPDDSVDAAWCLGVLCTTDNHLAVLRELRRIVRPDGRCGLLVFVADPAELPEQPDGNNFPHHPDLVRAIVDAGFHLAAQVAEADLDAEPTDWSDRMQAVRTELERRHAADEAWQVAEEQSSTMGRLLAAGDVQGQLFVLS